MDPLKPLFYIVKLGFTGVYINFLISVQKHRLWVLVWTASPRPNNLCFEQKHEKYQIFIFLMVKFSMYLNRRVFVMFRGFRSCISDIRVIICLTKVNVSSENYLAVSFWISVCTTRQISQLCRHGTKEVWRLSFLKTCMRMLHYHAVMLTHLWYLSIPM